MKTERTGLDQDTPIEIIWQDETAVAVNKPAGLLVHNSKWAGPKETSLRQMVARQIDRQVYPVHRLDRPTSGVLIYALSRDAARLWHDQLARPDTRKTYIALARGKKVHDKRAKQREQDAQREMDRARGRRR